MHLCNLPVCSPTLPNRALYTFASRSWHLDCRKHPSLPLSRPQIGVGLYPLGALLNHSCKPNCMQSFGPGGRIEFRWVSGWREAQAQTIT